MNQPSSIIGACAVRVSRLQADGTPSYSNAQGAFALCGGISKFEHDFEVEKGKDLFEEDACGAACVIRKKPDRTKYATFKLTMCKSDYRLDEILGVAQVLFTGPTINGRAFLAAQGCGSATFGNGVAIELWSEQWDCDVALSGAPYMRSILPRCYLTPAGYTRENGVSLPVYNGFAQVNNNFDDGPFGDLDQLHGVSNWVYAETDDTALPVCAVPPVYIPTPPSGS